MIRIRRSAGGAFTLLLVLAVAAPAMALTPTPDSVDVDVPFTPVHTAYAEDFQIDDGGWTTSEVPPPASRPAPLNPDWEWGVPTSGPGQAFSGSKVWALDLDGPYRVPQCAAIMSPEIDLTSAGSASVSYRQWVHMDTGTTIAFHAGLLMVTADDGETLTTVTPQGGYSSAAIGTTARACLNASPTGQSGYSGGPSTGYQPVSVNLNAFAGQKIRFVLAFGTDGVGATFNGWYVDDFAVTVDAATTVEDFESSDGGFTVVSTAVPGAPQRGWSWDDVTVGPDHVGKVWATNPAGNYGHGECHWIESPRFQLGSTPEGAGETLGGLPITSAMLSWRQYFRTSSLIGQGVVQIGASDGTYTVVTPTTGYDRTVDSQLSACLGAGVGVYGGTRNANGSPMAIQRADLTPWLGEEISIRFLFASRQTGTTDHGWYVSDVKAELGFGAAARVGIPAPPGRPEAPFTRIATVYGEDFETSDGGWTVTGTPEWDWGEPVSPPTPPEGSLNMWGTQVRGSHNTGACSWLTSPPITLPGAGQDAYGWVELAQMEFDLYVDTLNRNNGSVLQVSADGGQTWRYVMPKEGYDNTLFTGSTTGGPALACLGLSPLHTAWTGPSTAAAADAWRRVTVDLTPYLGEEIMVRFGFASNASTSERRGVYLDRFVVAAGIAATAPDANEPGIVSPGWQVTGVNPSWRFGVPTTGPLSVRPGWATGLHGPYNSGECSAIVSRPIDTNTIQGLGRLELTFQHHFATSSTSHSGNIQVSNDDGATWTTVTPTDGYPVSLATAARDCLMPGATTGRGYGGAVTGNNYRNVSVDLRQYQGDTIRVRFAFYSPVATTRGNGWYPREIALTRGGVPMPLARVSATGILPEIARAFGSAADDDLRRMVEEGASGRVDVILTGPAHEGLERLSFDTRAQWMAWFDEQAEGYFASVDAAVASLGGRVLGRWSAVPAAKVRVPLDRVALLPFLTGARTVAEDYDGRVGIIEPEPGSGASTTNTGGRNQVEAEDIWALGYRGEGIRISIVDTGIDGTHEAFRNADGSSRIAAFANCAGITGCAEVTPFDDHGHGTHVGATAAGSDLYEHPTAGKFQEVGVAPRAQIIGAKFLTGSGSGTLGDALDALQWSFDKGADLTSNSWGGTCSTAMNPVLTLVNNQAAAGMLTVAAVGNNASAPVGPSCAKHAIAVGAIDQNENAAAFSVRGPCRDPSAGNFERICPDLVAKGVDVRSAIIRSGSIYADPSGYRIWSGTSMATPHVAGAAALIEQMKRDMTGSGWNTAGNAEREILTMTAKPLGSPSPNNTYGYGLPKLLNVHQFLSSADSANVVSHFSVTPQELWLGRSTTLAFGVRNLGVAVASGNFSATLERPDGLVQVLDQANISLGLFDARNFTTAFTVAGDVAPGTYKFRGRFDYTWTDSEGDVVTDTIAHSGTFVVNRVFVDVDIEGFEPQTTLLDMQQVTVSLENTGNEPGQSTVLEITVPDAYRFVPPDPGSLTKTNGQYSDPAPVRVVRDDHFGRTTLVYDVGTLLVDGTFSVRLNLLPVATGNHWIRAVAKYKDGAGTQDIRSRTAAQAVSAI